MDARIKKGDEEVTVPLEQVQPGMLLVIKTGERVAVDGVVVQGEATVQEAFIDRRKYSCRKDGWPARICRTYLEAGSIIIQAESW